MNRDWIFTPLGKGKIVHEFKNGTVAIELESGSGHIFRREDLFPEKAKREDYSSLYMYDYDKLLSVLKEAS